MNNEELKKKVEEFSTGPGVYLMKGEGGKLIYIGKAKNLRDRVRVYLSPESDSRYQIRFLMKRVRDIDTLVCGNEKEALLLENSLIKKHKPRYNIFLKDDKSYVSLRLSVRHPFPELSVTRRLRKDGALYFGPYTSAKACRDTVELVYRNFKLRTCSNREFANRSRPCLEYQIHRCTAPCVGLVTKEAYAAQVHPVRLLLEGKNSELVDDLKTKMEKASGKESFEEAAGYRDLIRQVEETLERQRVVKLWGGEQDIVYLYREGQKGMVAVLIIREGILTDTRFHPIDSPEEEEAVLAHFLSQFYLDSPFIPDEILISGPAGEVTSLEEVLSERKGRRVTIRIPQKGEKKDLLELARANASAQFAQRARKEFEAEEVLKMLGEVVGLKHLPVRIECYDISNLSGNEATASRVVFIAGLPSKDHYRHYKIGAKGPDDYAMMNEALTRRFTGDPSLPDLIVVDGGKGQLAVAVRVLGELAVDDVLPIAIAKGRGPGARAKGIWKGKKEEEIYLPGRKNPLRLRSGSPVLLLLQRIRDEAHRFAVKYHHTLRDKEMLT